VFNTILKKTSYDRRSFSDVMAMIALYVTYSFKTATSLQDIMKSLYLAKPIIEGKYLKFESFNLSKIGAFIKYMIVNGLPPIYSGHAEGFWLFKVQLFRVLQDKLTARKNKYHNFQTIDSNRLNIINEIFKGLNLSNQINIDLYNQFAHFFKFFQDNYISYPASWPTFYVKEDASFEAAAAEIQAGADEKAVKHSYTVPLEETFKMYEEWGSKLSNFSLVSRVHEVKKTNEIRDLSDTAILSLMSEALLRYNRIVGIQDKSK
jgi:hypothetical protein